MAEKTIEQKYLKKTPREHILLRPDMYIGSVKKVTDQMWIKENGESEYFKFSIIEYAPGLIRIYDEIVVNAVDQSVSNNLVKNIRITVNMDTGAVSVWNDGGGIPVVVHKEHNIYIPELIFGHLMTSTNYDDNQKRIVGGKNGYGAKLTNIYSRFFEIETVDSNAKKFYKQHWKNNMTFKSEPEISSSHVKGYTKITFIPDFKRFGMDSLTSGVFKLIEKRAYDVAACTNKDITIYFQNQKLAVKTFERYVDLYIGKRGDTQRVFESKDFGDGAVWEVAVCMNTDLEPEGFMQVSFVNGIATTNGGTHVDITVGHICRKLVEYIKSKATGKNKNISISNSIIKERLWVFVRATVVNPDFSSQSKDILITESKNFGYFFRVSDDFITKIAKFGLCEEVLNLARMKEEAKVARDTDGRKRTVIRNIPKLDDANFAGGAKSQECVLMLTEGDSAKATAISGMTVVGRDRYGAFPLRGKLLNVREATANQIANNQEIGYLKQILGLQEGKRYNSLRELRYGKVLILTDQDTDGSHIKGLLINMFHAKWPELLKFKGFISSMATPIVKVTKNRTVIPFYSLTEYNKWKENNISKGWKAKYYKGLGTSTSKEAKEYFSNIDKNLTDYVWSSDDCHASIQLAFDRAKTDERKEWLSTYNSDEIIEHTEKDVSFSDFIHQELKHFSAYSTQRAIPSVCDGLKPSQRKVIYTCLKFNIVEEQKVVEIAGEVSKQTSYHHGEVALQETIVGMAQNFVGGNNFNLLHPQGQFGTRNMGGKDHASARYIYTFIYDLTKTVFNPLDNPLLKYLDDDGKLIEPKYFVPIIPMILVNGCDGIGTGYSTSIPCYNPKDILSCINSLMNDNEPEDLVPWYCGFTGTIEKNCGGNEGNFISKGVIEKISDGILVITELPVGVWTSIYDEFIETITEGYKPQGEKKSVTTFGTNRTGKTKVPILVNYKKHHTDYRVKYELYFKDPIYLDSLISSGEIYKELKLIKPISTTNMHLWNYKSFIQKYNTPMEIIKEFYTVRLDLYDKRRRYYIEKWTHELSEMSYKIQFIEDVISEQIIIFRQKNDFIIQQIESRKYPRINDSYGYLTDTKIHEFSEEKIYKLTLQRDRKQQDIATLTSKTPKEIWKEELVDFIKKYNAWSDERAAERIFDPNSNVKSSNKKTVLKILTKEPSASRVF